MYPATVEPVEDRSMGEPPPEAKELPTVAAETSAKAKALLNLFFIYFFTSFPFSCYRNSTLPNLAALIASNVAFWMTNVLMHLPRTAMRTLDRNFPVVFRLGFLFFKFIEVFRIIVIHKMNRYAASPGSLNARNMHE